MKKCVKTATLILMSCAFVLINVPTTNAQESSEFTVPLSDPGKRGKLRAQINYGSVTVKGSARKDILVKYSSDQDNDQDKEKTKDGLRRIGGGGMDLEVTENGNAVTIHSGSWNNKLNLEVEVPSGMDLDVKTHNDGDLVVSNVQGVIEMTNHNGEISANKVSGSVVATTYNGEIKVSFDKVTEGAPMSFTTYNGDVDISFPTTIKAALKLKTERGDIYSDFDVDFKSTPPVQKKDTKAGVYKVMIDEWKRGEVNGGGPEITVKNYNGDIFIRKNK